MHAHGICRAVDVLSKHVNHRMRPDRRHVCALLALAALAGCASSPPKGVKSRGLTGRWSPIAAELGGKPFVLATLRGPLLITADRFEFASDKGNYTVVSTGRPGKIDIKGTEGPNAGREVPAIFDLKDDDLTVAYQLGHHGARPTEFVSPAGSRILLMRYKRLE